MGTVNIQNVVKQFGGQIVLDDVSIELRSGEIVGIVGPNGAGKTTIFKLITGQIQPDIGTVTRSRGMDIGYLTQEPRIGLGNTLHDEVLSVFENVLELERKQQALSERMAAAHDSPELNDLMKQYDRVTAEFNAAGGYAYEQKLNEILGGLGFSMTDRSAPMSVLSGGQKCRAALAKLLLQDSTYLLLDEPTNHLDIDAVRWLEKFLAGHHGGAAVVSHDRYLLDRLAQRIIEVDHKSLTSYPGNYTNYARVKKLRELTQERQYTKDQAWLEKEQAFIAKHMAGQRTKEAQGRRKRLERRMAEGEFVMEKPSARKNLKLSFDAEIRQGRVVIDVVDAAKRYGEKQLFEELSLQVSAGQRVGVTGPNGSGKTTLLKMILGQVEPDAGRLQLDPKAALGYYAQESTELDHDSSVIAEILETRPDFDERAARSFLARFLFRGDDVFKNLRNLSGGEQSRVRLCKLILQSPNLLIMDEPTNHLDIPSREALEQALDDYPGTIVAVSHDRYFLDRIVQQLLVVRANEHSYHQGNYSDYIQEIESRAKAEAEQREKSARRKQTPAKSKAPKPDRKPSRYDRMSMSELEGFIIATEEQVTEFSRSFSDPGIYKDGQAVAKLREEFEQLKITLAEAESAWARRVDRE